MGTGRSDPVLVGGGDSLDLRLRGLIGDRASAALVAADGTVDWYCPRRFDAPAALFRLLDADGGAVRLGPAGPPVAARQRYDAPGVPVLRTLLPGRESLVEVADHLRDGRLVRIATVLRGPADVALAVVPGERFSRPRKVERWSSGVAFGGLVVRGLAPDEPVTLDTGERVVVVLEPGEERTIVHTPDGGERAFTVAAALDSERRVGEAWRPELAEVPYDGPFHDAVLASVGVLRLLTERSSGAVVSSVTTSLPARVGNERNVDQRYAWLRDAAAVVRVWDRLGLRDWAEETRGWLAAVAGGELPLPPVLTAGGEPVPSEVEVALDGWRECTPVRVGNRAVDGLDLAGLAEVALVLDPRRSWPVIERLGDWLADHWQRPDHGRWDSRTRPRRLVASALAARVALLELADRSRARNPVDPVQIGWRDAAGAAGQWLLAEGRFGRGAAAGWRRAPGDDSSDASVLAWAAAGDLPGLAGDVSGEAEGRLRATVEQSLAQLSEGPFVHRHQPHVDDGFPPGQGPDLWASFTMVAALARAGRWDEAHARMEALLGFVGPLGLVPAQADPFTGDFRGNLPSAAAHAALVAAALALAAGPR